MYERNKHLLPYTSVLGSGLLRSNIVAIGDRDVCPGMSEDWQKSLGEGLTSCPPYHPQMGSG